VNTAGSHATFAMSHNQQLRPDDEDAMSPADWLADSEVAVTDSHPSPLSRRAGFDAVLDAWRPINAR